MRRAQSSAAVMAMSLLVVSTIACGGQTTSAGPKTAAQGARAPKVLPAPVEQGVGTVSLRSCLGWTNFTVSALVCSERMLRATLNSHRLTKPWTALRITPSQRSAGVASAPGLAHVNLVASRPFQPGQRLRLQGNAPADTMLIVHACIRRHAGRDVIGEAVFLHLGLENGGDETVAVRSRSGRLDYDMTRRDGRTVLPDLVWSS